jgi:nitrous oxidase accessory protein
MTPALRRWLGLLLGVALASGLQGEDDLRARIAAAPAGAELRVAAGVHQGPFVLTRPVRLKGEPGALLRGDGRTHVVAIEAPDCEVSGFIIERSGVRLDEDIAGIHISAPRAVITRNEIRQCLHGIYIRKADDCRIVGNTITGTTRFTDIPNPVRTGVSGAAGDLCTVEVGQNEEGNGIHMWNSSGHLIEGNRIEGTRDGMYFSFTSHCVVRENVIRRVRYGLHYMYSNFNTFEHNHFSENAAGSALMFSSGLVLVENEFVSNRSHRAYGLLLQSVNDTRVERNLVEGNTLGIYLEHGNNNRFIGNRILGNYVGLRMSDSSTGNVAAGNLLAGNLHPVETTGSNEDNAWAEAGRGNTWEGQLELDLDGDGVADLPHHEPDVFGLWRRTFPEIGLLSASPGERLVRFLHQRLNLPGIPTISDPSPVVRSALP